MKYCILILIVFRSFSVFAQTESVYLQMDKSAAYPGDTIWFRGYIFDESHISARSTNFYVELYDDADQLQSRCLFPIANGTSLGQVSVPKKPGLYWLRSYTRNSGFFFTSIAVRGNGPQLVTRSFINPMDTPAITDTAGIAMSSLYTSNGVSVSVVPGEKCQLYGKNFKLLIKNYRDTVASKELILQRGHQLQINIPIKDIKGFLSLLFYTDGQLIARQEVRIPQSTIPVSLSFDTGKCTVTIHDEKPCSYALAVVAAKANNQNAKILDVLSPPGPQVPVNESGLTYSGRLDLDKKKNLSEKKIGMIVMLEHEGSHDQTNVVTLDSTRRFSLSGLAFQDTAILYYGLNGNGLYGERKIRDFEIHLDPQVFPAYKAPGRGIFRYDTLTLNQEDIQANGTRFLKTVIIKGKKVWSERNKSIDKRYVSGRFNFPTHFNYNLMDTSNYDPEYVTNILLYLNRELPMFKNDGQNRPSFKGKNVTFYLDEQLVNYKELLSIPITELAYVKVIEDFVDDDGYTRAISGIPDNTHHAVTNTPTADFGTDNSPGAMVCIYHRKGKDLQNMASDNMKTISLVGYNRSEKWTMPDRSTLLWMPYIHDKNYTFSLPKAALNGSYKLILEGIDADGAVFHLEHDLK